MTPISPSPGEHSDASTDDNEVKGGAVCIGK